MTTTVTHRQLTLIVDVTTTVTPVPTSELEPQHFLKEGGGPKWYYFPATDQYFDKDHLPVSITTTKVNNVTIIDSVNGRPHSHKVRAKDDPLGVDHHTIDTLHEVMTLTDIHISGEQQTDEEVNLQ